MKKIKTINLAALVQNPDNPQKYGEGEIAALVASIRKEPRTLAAVAAGDLITAVAVERKKATAPREQAKGEK